MENYKRSLCLSFLLLSTLIQLSSACGEVGCVDVFGAASKFNLYASGNITLRGVDSAGTICTGGSAFISAYSVLNLKQFPLIVKGDLNIGGVLLSLSGSVVVGGNKLGDLVFLNGGILSSVFPLDISLTTAHLLSLSTCWAGLAVTGLSALAYGKTTFTCRGESNVQVFNMAAEDFHSFGSYGYEFVGCSASQTIVINVAGFIVNIQNGQGTYGSISPSKVVFNFYQATSITIKNTAFISTVLAPLAVITGSSAPVCQIFAKGLVGDSSFTFVDAYAGAKCYFDGCLPVPRISVPVLGGL